MARREDRLTRQQVLDLSELVLRDFGWSLHLTAYRTHTGNPSSHPWTGPIAWETRISTTFQESGPFLKLVTTIQSLGLDVQIVGGDEDGAQVRIIQPEEGRIISD